MRLYIPRKCGGRGFSNGKNLHDHSLKEHFLKIDVDMHKEVAIVDKDLTPLCLGKENGHRLLVLANSDRITVWKTKDLHSRFYRALVDPDVDTDSSLSWYRSRIFSGETEYFVSVIMDEVIKTENCQRYYKKLHYRHLVSSC